eukprot:1375671-Amorphochlora_amoeboformis.AAC.2
MHEDQEKGHESPELSQLGPPISDLLSISTGAHEDKYDDRSFVRDRAQTSRKLAGNMEFNGKYFHRRSVSDMQAQGCVRDVITTFGGGKLIRRRSDGISVVKLRFCMAYLPSTKALSIQRGVRYKIPKCNTINSTGSSSSRRARGGVESLRKMHKLKDFLGIDRLLQKNIASFKHKLARSSEIKMLKLVHLTRGGYVRVVCFQEVRGGRDF